MYVNQAIDEVIQRALSEIVLEDPTPNLMATDGTLCYRLENGEKTNRNKTNFHERTGITSFAANIIDGSPLSAFLLIIC